MMTVFELYIKFAHSREIKLVNWMSSSCNTVAIELIGDFSCDIITNELVVADALSMQSSYDL